MLALCQGDDQPEGHLPLGRLTFLSDIRLIVACVMIILRNCTDKMERSVAVEACP